MKKAVWSVIIIFSALNGFASPSDFFADADQFFKKYVENGFVNYSKVKSNKSDLDKLYKHIADQNLTGFATDEKKAFYINAYNIIVIYSITNHYPVKSPMDIKGFFDEVKHTVAGEKITLNDLEKKKLLQPYQDARFHFVLVCAARSCPTLADFAYTPDQLEDQLNVRVANAVNDNTWLKVNTSKKTVAFSKIFEWYKDDFIKNGESIIDWVNKYRKVKIPTNFKSSFYEYNWSLNDAGNH